MTKRQKRFCEEYLIDHDGTAAALRAGYKPGNAADTSRRLLKEEAIRARLRELSAGRQKKDAVMAQEEVLAGLSAIARGEKEGAKISEISKALELMGRYYGTFSEKKERESGGGEGLPGRPRDMTLNERKARLDELLRSFKEREPT